MKIVGTSGVSTLLAGQVMRRYRPVIYLKEPSLVNNHSAVLRFKSDDISRFLNIPFQKVVIDKAIFYKGDLLSKSTLGLQNMYSQKVTGNILDRSIRDMSSEVRYIAPDNFFDLLTIGLDIRYNSNLIEEVFRGDDITLSYVKMPDMMKHINHPLPEFKFNPVYTVNCEITSPEVDVYQTVYFPGDEDYYRASITKSNLIIEYINHPNEDTLVNDVYDILLNAFKIGPNALGDIKFSCLPVGKMSPIDDHERKDFIYKLTDQYNIWSFGRNGIWKSIRLDALFNDLHRIDTMIRSSKYQRNLNL